MAKRQPKQTHYERSEAYAKQVSGEIIEQIKKGTAPWQKPWKPGEQHSERRMLQTGKAYTGGNSLYLMSRQISEGRGDNRWGTYRQIEAMGGQVRRGEKGTQVLFYQNRTEQPAKDEEGKIRKDKDGKMIYEEAENVRPVMRQYTVFNVEQTNGLKLPPRKSRGRRRNGTRTGRPTKCYAPAARSCSTSPVEIGLPTRPPRTRSCYRTRRNSLRAMATTRRRCTRRVIRPAITTA